ncbi:MAG: hypothetical protein WA021_00460 [Minisyncoccia bacterium]
MDDIPIVIFSSVVGAARLLWSHWFYMALVLLCAYVCFFVGSREWLDSFPAILVCMSQAMVLMTADAGAGPIIVTIIFALLLNIAGFWFGRSRA